MESKLERKIVTFGERGSTDVLEFSVKFGGEPNEIQYIHNGCSCTKAWFDYDTNSIKGTLDLNLVGTIGKGKTSVNKVVTVYYNDGQGEFIADKELRRVPNKDKRADKINLACIAVK